jgi:putative CocE/NonD family hydrolase
VVTWQDKPVKLFVMGPNIWREEDDWPLPDTRFRPYYLHSSGHANTAAGNDTLSTAAPADESEDVYLYDPRDPVPTNGGATFLPGLQIAVNAGPRDQRGVETRDDVLCYTTAPLERPVEVTGPIELVLFASSSAKDTDFTAKLVDVYPGGRAESITDGILRARYRETLSKSVLMEPNRVYDLHITVGATAQVFTTEGSHLSRSHATPAQEIDYVGVSHRQMYAHNGDGCRLKKWSDTQSGGHSWTKTFPPHKTSLNEKRYCESWQYACPLSLPTRV